jgi:hypothetical protein
MACSIHEELVTRWKQIIWQPHEDDDAIAAYWDSIDHKQTCEVCRDEELLDLFARMKQLIF